MVVPLPAAVVYVAVALSLAACDRLDEDRARAEQTRQAAAAIEAYSAAAERANSVHAEVLAAFAEANAARNLRDYRDVLRRKALPTMERFVVLLRAMPTGNTELGRIHSLLVDGYSEAHIALSAYVEALTDAEGLRGFAPIRGRLQARVDAYRQALAAYYVAHGRRLRAGPGPGAIAPPMAATSTGSPPAPGSVLSAQPGSQK